MKKLANISPFILLLVPIFVMMLLIFTTSLQASNENADMASRSTVKTSDNGFLKVSTNYVK